MDNMNERFDILVSRGLSPKTAAALASIYTLEECLSVANWLDENRED